MPRINSRMEHKYFAISRLKTITNVVVFRFYAFSNDEMVSKMGVDRQPYVMKIEHEIIICNTQISNIIHILYSEIAPLQITIYNNKIQMLLKFYKMKNSCIFFPLHIQYRFIKYFDI